MILALLVGSGLGLGGCLLIAGLAPAPESLAAAYQRLQQPSARVATRRAPSADHNVTSPARGADAARAWLGNHLAARIGLTGLPDGAGLPGRLGGLTPDLTADLAVTGTTPELHAGAKILAALVGLATPALLGTLLSLSGVGLPLLVPLWISLTSAIVAFLLPDLRLRRAAAEARRSFRTSVGAFLDLVAMRMASGSGLAEALHSAAAIGAGPAFAQIRGALADARTDGLSPAQALGQLGEDLHLPDLVDTSTRLRLVDASGAQAQQSLRAQAGSLRDRELSDAQGRANEQSQSMLVAQVVLGIGFLVFLGYPAVARVLAA
ncbi:MAG: Flp pilus assembly protein TadB [Frankiales bacterium]|nr:Flp pilus assembly protein TadB [Frankiales bacterium]